MRLGDNRSSPLCFCTAASSCRASAEGATFKAPECSSIPFWVSLRGSLFVVRETKNFNLGGPLKQDTPFWTRHLWELSYSKNSPTYLLSTPRSPPNHSNYHKRVGVCSEGMLEGSWILSIQRVITMNPLKGPTSLTGLRGCPNTSHRTPGLRTQCWHES